MLIALSRINNDLKLMVKESLKKTIMDLNFGMASLDLQETIIVEEKTNRQNESDSSSISQPNAVPASECDIKLRRSTRLKMTPETTEKRRVISKPTKLSELSTESDVKNYYLNKTVKMLPPALETIFEDPKPQSNGNTFLSSRKYRRMIEFKQNLGTNKMKTKKRQTKAKKLLLGKKYFNRKRVSMSLLLEKLSKVDDGK